MRAVCGRVRTAVLLSYPGIIPQLFDFVNPFFEKNLTFSKVFYALPYCDISKHKFDADDIFCRMTILP